LAPKIQFTELYSKMAATDKTTAIILTGPKRDISYKPWWDTFLTTQKALNDKHKNKDYILPQLTGLGFQVIPHPCPNYLALAWLRTIVTEGYKRRGVALPENRLNDIFLSSLRVSIPDMGYVLGLTQEQRRNLGRWESSTSTDTYTRSHRGAVVSAWHTLKMNFISGDHTIPLDTDRMVPEEEPQDPPAPGTPEPAAKRIKRDIDSGRKRNRIENMPKPAPGAPRHTAKIKDGLLRPRLIYNLGTNKQHWVRDNDYNNILLTGKTIGCSWAFTRKQVHFITDKVELPKKTTQCVWCFKQYGYPQGWDTPKPKSDTSDNDSSSDSDSSGDEANESDEDMKPITTQDNPPDAETHE
jgi:hypothetical protein